MDKIISKETRRRAAEILEMLEEPELTIHQRLDWIEKELRKLKRAGVLEE